MIKAEFNDPLGWKHDIADVPAEGATFERSTPADVRRHIASALDLKSCDRLDARYRIRPIAGGGYRLSGELRADVVQACVITLEAVPGRIEEAFDVEYWPDVSGKAVSGPDEIPALTAAEIEPLVDGRIDAGRIVYEQFAASLDPYPRKEGAELDAAELGAGTGPASPFAVLAKLRADKAPPSE